jgi:hypothetical protein
VLFSGTVYENLAYGRYAINFSPLLSLSETLTIAQANHREQRRLQWQRVLHTLSNLGNSQEGAVSVSSNGRYSSVNTRSDTDQEYYDNCFTRLFRNNPRFNGSDPNPRTSSSGDIELGIPNSKTDSVDEDIVNAAKFSHAHGFISTFSQQYHTIISTMGSGYMVSGGQKQRLSVARAMLKQPKILLLDEATSALDAQSEQMIQQSIDALTNRGKFKSTPNSPVRMSSTNSTNWTAGSPRLQPTVSTIFGGSRPTVIIVAHRLSTIINADRIVVIEKGELKEVGPHDELMAIPDGIYRALYLKQAGGGKA